MHSPKAASKAVSKGVAKAVAKSPPKVKAKLGATTSASSKVNLMSRNELVTNIFNKLRKTDVPVLGPEELLVFAELLDFTGSEQDWEREYFELCLDAKCDIRDGISAEGFSNIINEKESSCACTDAELRTILVTLDRGADIPRMLKSLTRPELVWMLFNHLSEGSTHLNSQQLRVYAQKVGFEGTSVDWNREYHYWCSQYELDPQLGAMMIGFDQMVSDERGDCYASDTDLRIMLEEAGVKPADAPQLAFSYDDLVSKMFFACGPARNDRLGVKGLYLFAQLNGFKGDARDFTKEYMAMSLDNGWDETKGVSISQFDWLVRNKDSACYSTAQSLRKNLADLVLMGTLDVEILRERQFGCIGDEDENDDGTASGKVGDSEARRSTRGTLRTREDAAARIQKLVRKRRGSGAGLNRNMSLVASSVDPEQEMRKVETDHLYGIQSMQRAQALHAEAEGGDGETLTEFAPPRDKLVRPTRETVLLQASLVNDAAAIAARQQAQIQQEQRARVDAAQRIQNILRGRPSLQIQDPQTASDGPATLILKSPGSQKAGIGLATAGKRKVPVGSAKTPTSPGGASQSPASRSQSPRNKAVSRAKPLDTSSTRRLKACFSKADIPSCDALATRLGKAAVRGMAADSVVAKLVREVWRIPRTDISEKDISALCATLDPQATGKIALKKLVDFAGVTLTLSQQEMLKGSEDSPSGSEHESLDTVSRRARAAAYTEMRAEAIEDAEIARIAATGRWREKMPPKEQVTSTFLNAHPTFIMKAIKVGTEELCLHTLERLGHRGVNQTDMRGCTVLHLGAESNFGRFCDNLLSRASFIGANARDYNGWTALHRGARMGAVDACRKIMAHPRFTAVNDASPKDGWSALHLAAMHGHTDVCYMMVHDPRCDIAAMDSWGRTALHAACEHGHHQAISALLEKYSEDKIRLQNKWSQTALQTCFGGPDSRVAKFAAELIANLHKDGDDDDNGNPPAEQKGITVIKPSPKSPNATGASYGM